MLSRPCFAISASSMVKNPQTGTERRVFAQRLSNTNTNETDSKRVPYFMA